MLFLGSFLIFAFDSTCALYRDRWVSFKDLEPTLRRVLLYVGHADLSK